MVSVKKGSQSLHRYRLPNNSEKMKKNSYFKKQILWFCCYRCSQLHDLQAALVD